LLTTSGFTTMAVGTVWDDVIVVEVSCLATGEPLAEPRIVVCACVLGVVRVDIAHAAAGDHESEADDDNEAGGNDV